MIIGPRYIGGSGGAGASPGSLHEAFMLSGPGIYFAPFFSPQRIQSAKERNLSREENFCGGEDVTDIGSKNREMHVSGVLLGRELQSFDNIVDSNNTLDLVTDGWQGEVRVLGGEWEGPVALEPQTGQRLYKYSFDFVSTGKDETSEGHEDGIISDGTS